MAAPSETNQTKQKYSFERLKLCDLDPEKLVEKIGGGKIKDSLDSTEIHIVFEAGLGIWKKPEGTVVFSADMGVVSFTLYADFLVLSDQDHSIVNIVEKREEESSSLLVVDKGKGMYPVRVAKKIKQVPQID